MSADDSVYRDLDEYVRQSEPDAAERGYLWQTAIGLQAVEGLTPSTYLIEMAKRNIDGDIFFARSQNEYKNTPQMPQRSCQVPLLGSLLVRRMN